MVRDLGTLAAIVHRRQRGQLRVLETMTGSGIRALRYGLEAEADWIWTNDANPEMGEILTANLKQLRPGQYQITHQGAKEIFARCCVDRDQYDLVDVDGFGNPSDLLDFLLETVKLQGLIYLTATDGRSLAGHSPSLCLQRYGAYGRAHPSAQEQGLRILIGSLGQRAAARGLGIAPVFSLFTGQTFRVMVRLLPKAQRFEQSYGFLGYCHSCGEYQTLPWPKLGRVSCPHPPTPQPLTFTGPMWLGGLHDRTFLVSMQTQAQQRRWSDCVKLLGTMIPEAQMPPYFFGLGDIGRRGKIDPPKREGLIKALQQQGYTTSLVHWNSQAIRTNATLGTCIALAKNL
jgi:tRNA (guanine26-N2/guanine27-N2)-dimethyltransferase